MPYRKTPSTFGTSAYGGNGWVQRTQDHRAEIGSLWSDCGIANEWATLRAVLMHRPGPEITASDDPEAVNMLAPLDLTRAQTQHDAIAAAFEADGVHIHRVEPSCNVSPNLMFCADLMFSTLDGVILARPASSVRAGEERWIARRLADLGVPILATLTGQASFEGADAMWLDDKTVVIGRGHRTNQEGIDQITDLLARQGVETVAVDMPYGTMHLMGMIRFMDRDLAIAWPRRTPHALVSLLKDRGYQVAFLPTADEAEMNRGLNCVTLGPRRILMVAEAPAIQSFYETHDITCITTPADELSKAAGAVGCLTGVLTRQK